MNQFYFGVMSEYIEAGYAPTNRANCKVCKQNIPKDSLRIGLCSDDDHFNARYWHHLDCFNLKPRFKDLDPETQIYQLENLEEEDCEKVVEYMKNQVERLREGKKKSKVKPAAEEKNNSKKEDKSKSKSKTKPKKEKANEEDSQPKRAQTKKQKKKAEEKQSVVSSQSGLRRSSRSKSKSVSKSQIQDKKETKKSAKNKKIKAKPKPKIGYTPAQQKYYKELLNEYMSYTADKLKAILGANAQPKTGSKDDLIQKCADGKVLGRIPTCPQCGGGKLRFNYKTGIYKCPGYMDDDEFRNCHKVFTLSEITRTEWTQP